MLTLGENRLRMVLEILRAKRAYAVLLYLFEHLCIGRPVAGACYVYKFLFLRHPHTVYHLVEKKNRPAHTVCGAVSELQGKYGTFIAG
jgi:hypothetical protein